ncbi:MAG: NnrU family protein [Hyphomicrobiaceae bacterium]|nr:MAG: NnrU family protein [Hyphomicrobiaceae bacterium]
MTMLVSGLVLFFLVHLLPTLPAVRAALVSRLGRGAYSGVFSLLSLIGLVLIVMGYAQMQGQGRGNPELWAPPIWIRHLVLLLMIPAVVLLVAAYVPSRVRTAVGHPMLAAVTIWAFAHLLANGDLASVLLFGGFLAFAVYDRISVGRRAALGPLGNAQGGVLQDALVIAAGLGTYMIILFWAHGKFIGVPLLP